MAAINVAFVHAPDKFHSELQNNGVVFMPVWAYTLASHLPDNGTFQLSLWDTRTTKREDIESSDIFLFSGINQDMESILTTMRQLRARFPDSKYLLGGPIAWSLDQAGDGDRLYEFDHIFIGDGEEMIEDLLLNVSMGKLNDKVVRSERRFDVANSKPLHQGLLGDSLENYYGGIIEVSRGCPFLCEFCDIRILPDNNRPHSKPVDVIIADLDFMARKGVKNFLLACDNFIGDPRWAEAVVDRILEWQDETGLRPNLYTWLTINLYKMPRLMQKMRRAGFDAVFIGIESFNENSLLETAKVQNTAPDLVYAIKEVQSYGFFVIAGLIIGFDSDDETSFDVTIKGIREAGLLSGDPSLLTALPGTPLYRRMKLANRLRDVRYGLGGFKYETNIKYLMPRETLIDGYCRLAQQLYDARYQYDRLVSFFENLHRGNFIPIEGAGYVDFRLALKSIIKSPTALRQVFRRARVFASRPVNFYYLIKAWFYVRRQTEIKGRNAYFNFWLSLWTNVMLRYDGIGPDDFNIEGIEGIADINSVLPSEYLTSNDELIPEGKIRAQQRATVKGLTAVIERVKQAAAE